MTELLYYTDQETASFKASATECFREKDLWICRLDKTYFYPEGGGQPADKGTIEGLEVLDVRKNGAFVDHVLAGDPRNGNGQLECRIDKEHRFEYMQQHTGQHIISAALMKTAGIATVSVRQGEDYTSIETGAEEISPETLRLVEDAANAAICSNLPVLTHWTDLEGLAEFNLRRPTSKTENIRVVEIKDWDVVACGGLHLKTTGLAGLVKCVSTERIRGRIRLNWKIGKRAYDDYSEKTAVTNELSVLYSAPLQEITGRADALNRQIAGLKSSAAALENRLAQMITESLLSSAGRSADGAGIGILALDGEDSSLVKSIVRILSSNESPGRYCIVNNGPAGLSWQICACGGAELDFNRIRAELLPLIGGKGGGKYPLWQGIGSETERSGEFLEGFRRSAG